MKRILTFFIITLVSTASATVTLSFSESGGRATGFANTDGTFNGSRYGIVIDTLGNGFSSSGTLYDGFNLDATRASGLFLSVGGVATDDYFFASWDPTLLGGAGDYRTTVFSPGTQGGNGTITSVSDIPFNTFGITSGDPFALLWTSTTTGNNAQANSKYGFLSGLSGMTMPTGDGSWPYGATVFAGADITRLASNTFQGVPEPSRLLLLCFSGLGLIFRRRRP